MIINRICRREMIIFKKYNRYFGGTAKAPRNTVQQGVSLCGGWERWQNDNRCQQNCLSTNLSSILEGKKLYSHPHQPSS